MYRLIAAGLSVVLIGTFFSLVSFVPSSQQEDNVYYFGFFETFYNRIYLLSTGIFPFRNTIICSN